MARRNGLILVTADALAIAAVSPSAFAGAARDRAAVTTELSADNAQDKKNKTAPKTVAPKQAPPRVQVQPRVIRKQTPVVVVPKQTAPRVIQRQVTPQPKYIAPKNVTVTPRVVTTPKAGQTTTVKVKKVYTPSGSRARVVTTARIRSAPARGVYRTTIRGRNYSVWRSGYRARYHGGWRTFVALSALGVLAIGAAEYYPYAYIDAPANYCDGLTEDGCQLVYDEVETVEGDMVGQCVAYCPWQ